MSGPLHFIRSYHLPGKKTEPGGPRGGNRFIQKGRSFMLAYSCRRLESNCFALMESETPLIPIPASGMWCAMTVQSLDVWESL